MTNTRIAWQSFSRELKLNASNDKQHILNSSRKKVCCFYSRNKKKCEGCIEIVDASRTLLAIHKAKSKQSLPSLE